MRRAFKWLAIVLIGILLLILCTLLITYLLLGTEKGLNLTVSELEDRIQGLEIGAVVGNLKSGVQTDQFAFKNDQVNLTAKGIDTKWRSGCLLDKELCIDKIVIDDLYIETFASDTQAPASTDDIALPNIELPVSFDAKEILVKNLTFKAPGDGPVQALQNIKLSAFSEQNTLRINEISTQYKNIKLNASGSITTTGTYPLDLYIQVDADDFLEEFDATSRISLSNSLANLDVDMTISGAVNATMKGSVKPLLKRLPIALDIKSSQAGWPLDTNQIAQANDVVVSISGDMNDYQLALQGKVNGEQIPATTLSIAGFANTERAVITDLTALTLDGFATGNAAVSWHNGIVWVTELIAKDINPAAKFEGVDGKLNGLIIASGDLVDEKWTLDLQKAHVDGMLRDVPFSLDTKLIKQADETWHLDSLVLDNGRNSINASGSLSDVWDLNAIIKLPELQNLLPGLTGEFDASLDLAGELKNPDVNIEARSKAINYNEIAVSGFSLNGDIKRGALDDSTLALKVAQVLTGGQSVSNTKLNLAGSRNNHTIALFADGPEKTSIDLNAAGGLTERFDWNGVLKKIKLEVPAHEINLRNPTSLAWNNVSKKFSVQPHCWSIQESNLCLKNQVLAQETGQAVIALDAYRLEQLDPFLPAESTLRGKLKADIKLDWGPAITGGYTAKLDTAVTDGGINVRDTRGQPLSFKYDTLTLNTRADAQAVNSTLTIDSKSMGQAQVDLMLDPASPEKNISGKVNLSGFKIGFLKAFLPNFETISGEISANGDLGGQLTDPLYNGDVVVSSLIVRSDDLPLSIDGGKITTQIAGKRADIDGQIKSGEGSVAVTGRANWLNDSYRADIKINAKQLSIAQDPLTSSTVNTKLTISAKPERIRIRGNIDIPAAEINIKEIPRGAATLSDDVIIVEDIFAQTQQQQKKNAAATIIDLKVNVGLGDDVNLAGYGLTASLTGNMAVSQISPNPVQLGGEVTIVSGIYKQYGQDLKITDGQVLFVGPIDQTTLNIDAVREIEDQDGKRTAGLHIEGRLEDPEISLFTEPADKTQESILSYIVLGRDIGADSGQDSLLASAALALTLKGGRAISDNVAEAMGIQEISLDARTRGDTTELVVSGRVNDNLLVRYGQSVFDGTSTLYLRYDLTKQLYLEAAGGVESAVDVFYTFSF